MRRRCLLAEMNRSGEQHVIGENRAAVNTDQRAGGSGEGAKRGRKEKLASRGRKPPEKTSLIEELSGEPGAYAPGENFAEELSSGGSRPRLARLLARQTFLASQG